MAKSTKDARNIVVHDVKYRWRATGNDGYISLIIWPDADSGPAIACSFDYHQTAVPTGDGGCRLTNQIVITNRLVRRVIEHAVGAFAYDPRIEGKQLNLRDVDRVIDISDAAHADK